MDEKIISIINCIRKTKRKRPMIKDIFQEVNKSMEDQDKLTFTVFRDIMDNLQSLNVIFDGGKNGKESFKVTRDASFCDDLKNDSFIDVDENMFEYIDDKFYEIVLNRIKIEVKSEVTNEINRLCDNDNSLDTKLSSRHEIAKTDIIADILKAEIDFLKNEIASKNKIIETLLKDRTKTSSDNCNNNNNKQDFDNNKDNDPFVEPRDPIKSINEQHNRSNTIALTNRFDILSTMPISSSGLEDNYDETVNNIPHNSSTESIKADSIKHNKKYRSTTIMGSSLIKDIKAYKMRHSITKGDRIYVKSFPGATISDMEDYVKPSLKYNPDLIILQIGTNDLRTLKTAECIADDIITLSRNIKTCNNDILISGLIARNDEYDGKRQQVNIFLINKCAEQNIFYLDNSNITARKHLNGSGVHLNYAGTLQLANNYLNAINV